MNPEDLFVIPPFTQVGKKCPPKQYVWWSWHPAYPYWSRSCWKAQSISEAVALLDTNWCASLKNYHNKLIKEENNLYEEVLDVPCECMDMWVKFHSDKANK